MMLVKPKKGFIRIKISMIHSAKTIRMKICKSLETETNKFAREAKKQSMDFGKL